ncbi:hypothetical protein CQW23_18314 [Capsicum baccatum]|uniref:F-box/LRR-repeat protein 15/At3g58940/PEG3-like LRR domain-containing protein n=1 Tax=Capsicum baccatum TaxID=33114 RepID=A0A2G2WGJ8_CAPBA|nr:hypothetical protein CQW23_18314 [Capsicum baccatum]
MVGLGFGHAIDENRPGHAREAGNHPSVVPLIFHGHLGGQTGKLMQTGHFQAKTVCYSPWFRGWDCLCEDILQQTQPPWSLLGKLWLNCERSVKPIPIPIPKPKPKPNDLYLFPIEPTDNIDPLVISVELIDITREEYEDIQRHCEANPHLHLLPYKTKQKVTTEGNNDDSRVRFNSLMTLTLSSVVLTNGHLEGILSSCSNLKKLTIECSKLPSTLQLTGKVIDVVILECDGGQEIDLHAAYLRMIECRIRNDVTFFFKFAPMLENIMVSRCFGHLKNSYIFGDHARDLPWVKSLTLEFLPGQVVKVAIQMEMRGSGRPPSLQGHNRLKEVIYCGFDGSEVEMEFVVYILKCAIVLEQVFLSPRVISYFSSVPHPKANLSFSEEKRNSIQQKQHGQAFSSKARVVIQ